MVGQQAVMNMIMQSFHELYADNFDQDDYAVAGRPRNPGMAGFVPMGQDIRQKHVVVDPGHSHLDGYGTYSPYLYGNEAKEAYLNMEFADKVKDWLSFLVIQIPTSILQKIPGGAVLMSLLMREKM